MINPVPAEEAVGHEDRPHGQGILGGYIEDIFRAPDHGSAKEDVRQAHERGKIFNHGIHSCKKGIKKSFAPEGDKGFLTAILLSQFESKRQRIGLPYSSTALAAWLPFRSN